MLPACSNKLTFVFKFIPFCRSFQSIMWPNKCHCNLSFLFSVLLTPLSELIILVLASLVVSVSSKESKKFCCMFWNVLAGQLPRLFYDPSQCDRKVYVESER